MRGYSIVDLLVDQYYKPTSLRRRFNGGIINLLKNVKMFIRQRATRLLLFVIAQRDHSEMSGLLLPSEFQITEIVM
jgi:hypothetical protein